MRVLIHESDIQAAVRELARRLRRDYDGRPLTVLGVMTGSLLFLSDLIRELDLPLQVGLIQASSYREGTTPGTLVINDGFLPRIEGRDVLLLDDIYDTGQTLARLLSRLKDMGPASLKSAVLLWKEGRQTADVVPDYHCFKIPDHFVVGYGLDFNHDHRHLRHIAIVESHVE